MFPLAKYTSLFPSICKNSLLQSLSERHNSTMRGSPALVLFFLAGSAFAQFDIKCSKKEQWFD